MTMTEYTFEIRGTVKVSVQGVDTEDNYQIAMQEAVKEAAKEIDGDWINDCLSAEESNDYEE